MIICLPFCLEKNWSSGLTCGLITCADGRIFLRLRNLLVVALLLQLRFALGIRFVIHKEECLSHRIEYAGDTVHVSFFCDQGGFSMAF